MDRVYESKTEGQYRRLTRTAVGGTDDRRIPYKLSERATGNGADEWNSKLAINDHMFCDDELRRFGRRLPTFFLADRSDGSRKQSVQPEMR